MKKYQVSKYLSYMEKDSVIAVYIDFSYFFFSDLSAKYFIIIMNNLKRKESIAKTIPESFVNFLLEKKIILEV